MGLGKLQVPKENTVILTLSLQIPKPHLLDLLIQKSRSGFGTPCLYISLGDSVVYRHTPELNIESLSHQQQPISFIR